MLTSEVQHALVRCGRIGLNAVQHTPEYLVHAEVITLLAHY